MRRATTLGVGASILLTAMLAAVAQGSTHARRVLTHAVRAPKRAAAVVAPEPTLVPTPAAGESSQASPAPSTPQSSPAPAPVQTPAAPVVVSGGS